MKDRRTPYEVSLEFVRLHRVIAKGPAYAAGPYRPTRGATHHISTSDQQLGKITQWVCPVVASHSTRNSLRLHVSGGDCAIYCNITMASQEVEVGSSTFESVLRNTQDDLSPTPLQMSFCVFHDQLREKILHLHEIRFITPDQVTVMEWTGYSPPTGANRVRFPAGLATGFPHVGTVPEDAAGWRVFSGVSRFPSPFILAPLHTHLNHPHRLSRRDMTWWFSWRGRTQFSDWLHEALGTGPTSDWFLHVAYCKRFPISAEFQVDEHYGEGELRALNINASIEELNASEIFSTFSEVVPRLDTSLMYETPIELEEELIVPSLQHMSGDLGECRIDALMWPYRPELNALNQKNKYTHFSFNVQNLNYLSPLKMLPFYSTLISSESRKILDVLPQPGHSGISHVGIVPDNAVGRRVFSGSTVSPCPFIPARLHTYLNNPHRLGYITFERVPIAAVSRSNSTVFISRFERLLFAAALLVAASKDPLLHLECNGLPTLGATVEVQGPVFQQRARVSNRQRRRIIVIPKRCCYLLAGGDNTAGFSRRNFQAVWYWFLVHLIPASNDLAANETSSSAKVYPTQVGKLKTSSLATKIFRLCVRASVACVADFLCFKR
ncbi:hypothetical protein PR048_027817 [Dryococelus australis]|uniref:Uncharacterized protein n=1 Tax=Dryococelus australis TaxID=614101 RepID=A0ABQ9GHJ8_9NEOP|nr:hypothetical protein PR048_027817 [Dryococelus australis]